MATHHTARRFIELTGLPTLIQELSTLSPGNKRKFFGETVGRLNVKVLV
jgi:hypothetical protein